jgi:multiple sugar transport system ATP-binding protein
MSDIILRNIVKRFDNASIAVNQLNLEIRNGDFVTLLGPSGCGKTTILRMISGLETPTSGEIVIDGKVVFSSAEQINLSPEKRNVGFIFQNYALWPHMTVYKNIALGLENKKWSRDQIKARVKELLKLLHLEEFEHRYPSEMSGGQQQRVAIARTLATNPRILLMDEPMSNLDPKLRMEMRMELKNMHEQTKTTFVYVTHDQLEAMSMSTRICLLREGQLQQFGTPLEIYCQPANLFAADFVGNPGINLVRFSGENVNLDEIALDSEEIRLIFTPITGGVAITSGQKLVLGIRPENVTISKDGAIRGEVYSSLPSGMETVVCVVVGSIKLNGVLFGRTDFKIGEPVAIGLKDDDYPLFDAETGQRIALGKLEIV